MVGASQDANLYNLQIYAVFVACVFLFGDGLSGMQCFCSLSNMRSWLGSMLLSLLAIVVLIYLSI